MRKLSGGAKLFTTTLLLSNIYFGAKTYENNVTYDHVATPGIVNGIADLAKDVVHEDARGKLEIGLVGGMLVVGSPVYLPGAAIADAAYLVKRTLK